MGPPAYWLGRFRFQWKHELSAVDLHRRPREWSPATMRLNGGLQAPDCGSGTKVSIGQLQLVKMSYGQCDF